MMNAYYIRCRSADVSQLLRLGVLLGVLVETPVQHVAAPGIVWDPIGTVSVPTGHTDTNGQPVVEPVCDDEGVPLWHANLYTPFALLAHAQEMAQHSPEIANAVESIPRYFLVSDAGEAVPPRSPVRVLAGHISPTTTVEQE